MTPRAKQASAAPEVIDPIDSLLILNRGEIAVRILRTCVEMDIGAQVAYSTRDIGSLAVRQALELSSRDSRYGAALIGGDSPRESYEDITGVVAMARAKRLKAVHPGYGFLSESAETARRLSEVGIRFIGPPAQVIERVGSKTNARELAKECDVPLLPGTALLATYRQAAKEAKRIGFPLVLKAKDAGGGMGNLFVHDADQLKTGFENYSLRFPSGLYLEKKLERARHIELQIAADKYGSVTVLGDRDCTAQRKSQKVMEEAPALIVPQVVKDKMAAGAIRMAKKAGYEGVGTWEYLFDPATDEYYFMEINPRIQVEHTVTEERFDKLDIVQWQIRIASGERLPPVPPLRHNHVIQARLYAEDPNNVFRASPGTLQILRLPEMNGVRVDRGYEEGDTVPKGLDTTIAKIVATGSTREDAREVMAKALSNTTVTGVATNREFQLWLANTDEYRQNTVWTTYIEDAWQSHQLGRFKGVEGFISGGEFFEEKMPYRFVPEAYLQNLTYERRGKVRNYAEDLDRIHQERPDSCAFRYGIYVDRETGIRLALGYWDASFMGGSLGSEEGMAVAALFETAYKQRLPVAMITTSPGARQQEGAKALQMMDLMMAYRRKFEPPLFVNVYSGMNFGGVTVSIAEAADIRMAVNGSRIGFAGPDLVARMMGKQSGKDLPVGSHSAQDHYADRNLELVVGDLREARRRIVKLCADLRLSNYHGRYDYAVRPYGAETPTRRYDRPASQRSHTVIGEMVGRILPIVHERKRGRPKPSSQLTPAEKRALVRDPARPTSADYMDPKLGLFESVSPLSIREIKDTSEEYPPIIAGIARLGGKPVMVIGQQTQRRRDEGGVLKKVYVAQRAKDFEWARRQVRLANKLRLPIILFCDTTGGDASLAEEAQGVSKKISDFLDIVHTEEVTVPVLSVNIGENGSGGGLTFGRTVDGAADLSNAMTFVATPEAQIKILTDKWPSGDTEINPILNQIRDGTAQGRLAMKQIVRVIEEPPGGAQTDPRLVASRIRELLLEELDRLGSMDSEQLAAHRFSNVVEPALFAMRPNDPPQ